MKRIYAIVIAPPKDGEKYYFVRIPDLGLYTEGESVSDAIHMAKDCIGVWGISQEDAKREIPQATTLKPEADENEIVSLVEVDFAAYREQNENRAVRKNCTIPSWLNREAEARNMNFSAVLQEALRQQLGL